MAYTLSELGKGLLAQIYGALTGGDATVPAAEDSFVSWCQPGLPFQAKDFTFAAKGLGTGANAQADKLLIQQAFNFATVIDFIPKRDGIYNNDQQQTIWRTSEARLSHLYGEILRFSKVVHYPLSDKEKEKLEKFRKLLRVTKTVKDIITDEDKEVTEDGPLLRAYNEKMQLYITAALEYNNKRVAAQSAVGVEGKTAVNDWANNEPLYRLKVRAASDDWTSGGYRHDKEKIEAYINQVTQRDMILWKQNLLDFYEKSKMSGLGAGMDFFYTTLMPGNFASASGWTNFRSYHSSMSSSSRSESNAWSGGASVNFGFAHFGARGSGQSTSFSRDVALSSFDISFELCQVVICRPWFYPEFFMNKGWTLRPGEGWTYDQMPSDGKRPVPSGLMIAYPTTALFARNIKIASRDFASHYDEFQKSYSGGGSIGWGPFSLRGSYSHAESGQNFTATRDGASISVPGMQIICFQNHLIPKMPDPLPSIKPEDFA